MRPPMPKEHGAWGMVLLPLLCGVALGHAGGAGVVAVVMVLAAYLCRAPLEGLAKGRRGGDTWRWLGVYAGVAAAAAAALVVGWHRTAWLEVAVALLPVLGVTLIYASRRQSREVINELLGAVMLPASAAVGYAVGTNRVDGVALALWLSFALYNAVTLPYIRTWVLARRAGRSAVFVEDERRTRAVVYPAVVAAAALTLGLVVGGWWPWLLLVAYLPGWVRIFRGLPKAGRVELPIKRLGWQEMAHAATFALLAGVAFAVR